VLFLLETVIPGFLPKRVTPWFKWVFGYFLTELSTFLINTVIHSSHQPKALSRLNPSLISGMSERHRAQKGVF